MPVGFDHVVLTRFSVKFTSDQAPAADGWLVYRWAFFREAAASSMASQTTRDVTWLVFFDASSPDWLREEVGALAPGLFTPVWLNEVWSLDAVRRTISEHRSQPSLITTRFDSDDALGRGFIECVQRHAATHHGHFINLTRGIQVDRRGRLYRCNELSNAFLSFVETTPADSDPRTVFQTFRHTTAREFAPVLNVVSEPAWMQVVHGGNVSNEVRGLRINPQSVAGLFDIDLAYRTDVPLRILMIEWCQSQLARFRMFIAHPRSFTRSLATLWAIVRGTRVQAMIKH